MHLSSISHTTSALSTPFVRFHSRFVHLKQPLPKKGRLCELLQRIALVIVAPFAYLALGFLALIDLPFRSRKKTPAPAPQPVKKQPKSTTLLPTSTQKPLSPKKITKPASSLPSKTPKPAPLPLYITPGPESKSAPSSSEEEEEQGDETPIVSPFTLPEMEWIPFALPPTKEHLPKALKKTINDIRNLGSNTKTYRSPVRTALSHCIELLEHAGKNQELVSLKEIIKKLPTVCENLMDYEKATVQLETLINKTKETNLEIHAHGTVLLEAIKGSIALWTHKLSKNSKLTFEQQTQCRTATVEVFTAMSTVKGKMTVQRLMYSSPRSKERAEDLQPKKLDFTDDNLFRSPLPLPSPQMPDKVRQLIDKIYQNEGSGTKYYQTCTNYVIEILQEVFDTDTETQKALESIKEANKEEFTLTTGQTITDGLRKTLEQIPTDYPKKETVKSFCFSLLDTVQEEILRQAFQQQWSLQLINDILENIYDTSRKANLKNLYCSLDAAKQTPKAKRPSSLDLLRGKLAMSQKKWDRNAQQREEEFTKALAPVSPPTPITLQNFLSSTDDTDLGKPFTPTPRKDPALSLETSPAADPALRSVKEKVHRFNQKAKTPHPYTRRSSAPTLSTPVK